MTDWASPSSASARNAAWRPGKIDAGIAAKGFQYAVSSGDFASAVALRLLSRPSSVTRGGVNPRASPARMFVSSSRK